MAFQLTMGQCASIPVLLAQGMTQSEIARRLNCTWATVHHWVGQESPFDELRSGRPSKVTPKQKRALCNHFKASKQTSIRKQDAKTGR